MPPHVDASGVAVELPRPPRRIVSLIPSTTEILCALGLGDALVGVTVYCVEPRDVVRGKTRIGGEKDPDLARIRALKPDLVVANVEENRREDMRGRSRSGSRTRARSPRASASSANWAR
jgi:ABC-type Fe3+-hydroxamate transport system substrate-binding protein